MMNRKISGLIIALVCICGAVSAQKQLTIKKGSWSNRPPSECSAAWEIKGLKGVDSIFAANLHTYDKMMEKLEKDCAVAKKNVDQISPVVDSLNREYVHSNDNLVNLAKKEAISKSKTKSDQFIKATTTLVSIEKGFVRTKSMDTVYRRMLFDATLAYKTEMYFMTKILREMFKNIGIERLDQACPDGIITYDGRRVFSMRYYVKNP